MAIVDNIKTGFGFAADTVSEIASSIAEKNRLRTQLNAIKKIIKNDTATRDQAYIELGRFFYDNLREGASAENEALCAVIDTANERISKASLKYIEVLNLQNDTKIRSENAEKLARAIAEKTRATAQTAKERGAVFAENAKEFAAEKAAVVMDFAKEKADEIKEKGSSLIDKEDDYADIVKENAEAAVEAVEVKAEQAIEDAKEAAKAVEETVAEAAEPAKPDPEQSIEIEQLIREEQEKLKAVQQAPVEETPAPGEEESPESFDF